MYVYLFKKKVHASIPLVPVVALEKNEFFLSNTRVLRGHVVGYLDLPSPHNFIYCTCTVETGIGIVL